MYRLLLHPKIEKQLARIPQPLAERLARAIRDLRSSPRPAQAKALGQELYRLRLGDYRIVYAVFDSEQVVFVGKVARRSEQTYRDLTRILATARAAAAQRPPARPGEKREEGE
ncbi:MAG: type II toxin-antitoxin system RelE/ParE family toxin [Chloroflexi bacterium]|nr:type II toxin-antitoxin system RelE/ParE family toxin [Chloroflexota bacterium]